jgi:hypothetical protein
MFTSFVMLYLRKRRRNNMSSHSVRIARTLRQIQLIRDAHRSSARVEDAYSKGLYNGMEMILSLLTDKDPEYLKVVSKEQEEASSEVH